MPCDEQAILQNLLDAGCSSTLAAEIVKALQSGETARGLQQIARHRRTLLDALHAEQKRIDCLDYLVYRMRQTHTIGA